LRLAHRYGAKVDEEAFKIRFIARAISLTRRLDAATAHEFEHVGDEQS
jgi:hypothetical protein